MHVLGVRIYKKISQASQSSKLFAAFVFLVFIIPLFALAANVYNPDHDHNYSTYTDYAPTLDMIGVLDPVQATDQMVAVGGGSIEIVDEIVLRAETSPAGDYGGTVWVDRSSQIAKYLVRPGDTIGYIAEMYDVSVETIKIQNKIGAQESIVAGDVLEILPVTGVMYTVTTGDTVDTIAKKYNVTKEEIIAFNDIDDASLEIGTNIIIPGGTLSGSSKDSSVGKGSADTKTRIKVTADTYDLKGYIFPCDCIVTQGYGKTKFARASSYYKSNWHGGVDFSSGRGTGTPIVAIAAGTVTKVLNSGYNGGYGNYVKVLHEDGLESLYAHNSKNIVTLGQKVEQGQIIGYMGTSGRVTGPHVHLEIYNSNSNPFYTFFTGDNGF